MSEKVSEGRISIKQKIEELRKLIQFSYAKISKLQQECPHPRVKCRDTLTRHTDTPEVVQHWEYCTECGALVLFSGEQNLIGSFKTKEWEEARGENRS